MIEFIGRYEAMPPAADACDFVAGNPQEMPLGGFVDALRGQLEPRNKDWFAYKMSLPDSRRAAVAGLERIRGVRYHEADVHLTNGAFAGLAVAIRTIADPGDEVIYVSPPWFFYEAIISSLGAVAVRVNADRSTHDLDVSAIAGAITRRTRAVIVNSPNNPTGKIYPRSTLERLAAELERASARNGRRVYLVSDEAYSRILYGGRRFESPTETYPYSFLVYTYGKQLLTPGERIGYVALPPQMPASDRAALGEAIVLTQLVTGWAFPNAVLQYALADLERISIDLGHLERKRDRMLAGLRDAGYELHTPEGTFYLLPRSPWPDDVSFAARLAERRVYVLPGRFMEMPGWFRISLTASDEMIDRALPVFAEVARERAPAPVG